MSLQENEEIVQVDRVEETEAIDEKASSQSIATPTGDTPTTDDTNSITSTKEISMTATEVSVVEEVELETTTTTTATTTTVTSTSTNSNHSDNHIEIDNATEMKALSDAGSAFEELLEIPLEDKDIATASLILEETDYVDMPENASNDNASVNAVNAVNTQEVVDEMTTESATHETEQAFTDEQPTMEESTASVAIALSDTIEGSSNTDRQPSSENVSQTASHVSSSHEDENTMEATASTTSVPMPVSPMVSTSTVFLDKALKTIAASREAKRSKELAESTQKAIDLLAMEDATRQLMQVSVYLSFTRLMNIYTVFTPLQLACHTGSIPLTIAAIDCIEKLISYNDTSDTAVNDESTTADHTTNDTDQVEKAEDANIAAMEEQDIKVKKTIIDDIVTVICDAFIGENTDDKVTLQIIKALLAAVSQSERPVHQSALLRAVRTTYNIFLLSSNPANQTIAQGTLTQMVNIIFTRVQIDPKLRNPTEDADTPSATTTTMTATTTINEEGEEEKKTDDDSNESKEENDMPQLEVTESTEAIHSADVGNHETSSAGKSSNDSVASSLSSTDVEIRDAYLVFRALCKLSMKPVPNDSATDLRSLSMRSKLLALHLVLDVLATHQLVFLAPVAVVTTNPNGTAGTPATTTFISTIKQHLCLTLSRNLVSVIPAVFECALELFWQVLCNFRMFLKKEIEVFFTEIFLPILEMKNSPFQQRLALLSVLTRICDNPQMLVELYLNYDCDREALANIYERLVNVLSKTTTSRSLAHDSNNNITLQNAPAAAVITAAMPLTSASVTQGHLTSSTANVATAEISIRYKALESLVSILRSLVNWSGGERRSSRNSLDTVRTGQGDTDSIVDTPLATTGTSHSGSDIASTITNDDPEHFSHRKQRKQLLEEGVRLFGWKPKKGIRAMLNSGIIPSNNPQDIAQFLLTTEGIDKTMLGEYLGEGDAENIAIMHSFVDLMDFRSLGFVSSLRLFLQSFRLPGEAQKIDRFMLKFAERYVMYNPNEFANADAAYVLAYSVILLNTDQHNKQIKKRMTKEEFIRNNRGINDNADLPVEYLENIFDEIRSNEIKMNDAKDSTIRKATTSEQQHNFEHLSQRQRREAYAIASEELAVKTEAVLRSMRRNRQRRTTIQENVTFFNASHADHVKPMFEIPWMAFLAALSSPLQDSNDATMIRMCLEGFRLAVHIVASFEMDLARDAFISTLAKFTHLSNLNEMKPKNAKAIKCLLEIALAEGNALKESWKDILYCVSRLERVQLITGGLDEEKIPELSNTRKGSATKGDVAALASAPTRRPSRPSQSGPMYDEETAMEASSQEVVIMVDRIFTTSAQLSGTAIKHFVAALSQISWEEIQSSSHSDHPRIFSLQKLVEISYYNMNRIRMEWSNTWSIIGEHFIQVGSQSQQNACIFAIDSLRQLSMKFLEKEELSNFKFQREFLKPFVHIISHSSDPSIRDLVIRCLNQMIAARSNNIRSAKDADETIVTMAFNNVKIIFTKHYTDVVENGSLSDLVSCFIEFCRNGQYQKISLQSIEMFRQIMDRITDKQTPSFDSLIASGNFSRPNMHTDDQQQRIWIPILFGLFEVVMDCSDLEVRTRALDILFDALRKHGTSFSTSLWTSIFDGIVFPIFNDIKSPNRRSRFASADDMTVWFSTTLIKALRSVINLFTFYFEVLRPLLDRLFDLLCACVSQDDEVIAKAGCSCLLELIERNVDHLEEKTWSQVCTTFVRLLKTTSPYAVLHGNNQSSTGGKRSDAIPASELTDVQRCSMYCTLQLTILQTVRDMFNGPAYAAVQVDNLFSLVDAVARSYRQAQKFNKSIQFMESHPGFVALMPQLLEQEIGCLTGCIHMLLVMYKDNDERLMEHEAETERRLFPLSMDTLHRYSLLTVVGILTAFSDLPDDKFRRNLPMLYEQVIQLLEQAPAKEVRRTMHRFLQRVGQVYGILDTTGTTTSN
ncbi:hypothetical protein BDF22DRAFT_669905 [Syncephalis plumigaleata]|nr:hypothetical protein BDF22DRAFT_669905 [Syncephalis plumigaleata]